MVLFTTSPSKIEDGLRLCAHEVVVSRDADAMTARENSLDLVLDTVSAQHDISALLRTLRVGGALVLVGAPEHPLPVEPFSLIPKRRILAGSLIGGIAETQEMLDFCAEHGITSDVEVIAADRINEAYERMLRQDVRYRFVIDLATLS